MCFEYWRWLSWCARALRPVRRRTVARLGVVPGGGRQLAPALPRRWAATGSSALGRSSWRCQCACGEQGGPGTTLHGPRSSTRRSGRAASLGVSVAASYEPGHRRRHDHERWAGVHGQHADQRRPAPVRPIGVRIVDIDQEWLGDAAHDQVDGNDQSEADDDSPGGSPSAWCGGRPSSHSLKRRRADSAFRGGRDRT